MIISNMKQLIICHWKKVFLTVASNCSQFLWRLILNFKSNFQLCHDCNECTTLTQPNTMFIQNFHNAYYFIVIIPHPPFLSQNLLSVKNTDEVTSPQCIIDKMEDQDIQYGSCGPLISTWQCPSENLNVNVIINQSNWSQTWGPKWSFWRSKDLLC